MMRSTPGIRSMELFSSVFAFYLELNLMDLKSKLLFSKERMVW